MAYEYNPLAKEGFQKKPAVTPSDVERIEGEISTLENSVSTLETSQEDLKQKKVTKFFSASDNLEVNEIAEYQGNSDMVNLLTNGFFYKKMPELVMNTGSLITVDSPSNFKIFDYSDVLVRQEYYIKSKNCGITLRFGNFDNSEFQTVCFLIDASSSVVKKGWYQLPDNSFVSPFAFFYNSSLQIIEARLCSIYSINNIFYINGERFYSKGAELGQYSVVSLNTWLPAYSNGALFWWLVGNLHPADGIYLDFWSPFFLDSSDIDNAGILMGNTLPIVYKSTMIISVASTPQLLSYTATFNTSLFQLVKQPAVCDDALSDSSENPVQNKVLKAAFDALAFTYDFINTKVVKVGEIGFSCTYTVYHNCCFAFVVFSISLINDYIATKDITDVIPYSILADFEFTANYNRGSLADYTYAVRVKVVAIENGFVLHVPTNIPSSFGSVLVPLAPQS